VKRIRFTDPAGAVRIGTYADGTVSCRGAEYDVESVEVLPPSAPSKIVCVGLNYEDHLVERDRARPERPRLFVKTPNAVAGHGDTVRLPPHKRRIEFEGELAVVIGEQCRAVPAADALDVVAGFTCCNDISNRDDQLPEQNNVRAKCFDGALPIGPVLAPAADVPPDATLRTAVDGEVRQETTLDRMLFSIPEIIEAITAFMTLEPGDVVTTGTPAGVGDLADGARVTVEIEGIGTLAHAVERPA